MKILEKRGDQNIATAYLADLGGEKYVEFVESLGGAQDRSEKWVIILSSLSGCPLNCRFCDANRFYKSKLSKEEMMIQLDHILEKYGSESALNSDKFKVQFARIGDPALNHAVIETIEEIRKKYNLENYMPCISTIAPEGTDDWFQELKRLNHEVYRGDFQLQFSIHSTEKEQRDELMPDKKWSLEEIARYGKNFYVGGRKVTLNFALSEDDQIDPQELEDIFDPDVFAIKITPLNPTCNARENELINVFTEEEVQEFEVIDELRNGPFDVYVSIGELEENEIKSNCGQILLSYFEDDEMMVKNERRA